MKLTPIIEMLTPAPTANSVAAAQTSDQSSPSFSDSLIAASKASSLAGTAANDSSPRTSRQQGSAVDDAKTSSAGPNRLDVLPPTFPHQAALPQQILPAKQTRLTNLIVTPTQKSLGGHDSTLEVATVGSDQPMPNTAAPGLPEIESTIAREGVNKLDIIQSLSTLQGTGSVQTASILPGAKTQGIIAPIAPSPKDRANTSNRVVFGASNPVRKPVQNTVPTAASNEVQESLLKSFMYAQSSAVPNTPSNGILNAIQSVAPTAVPDEVRNTFPKTLLEGSSSEVPNDISAAVSNAFRNAAPNTIPNEDPLPKEFRDMQSIAAPSISSDAMPSAVQIGPESAASNEVRDTLPKTVLGAPQNSGTGVPSNEVSNAIQGTTQNTALNEDGDTLPLPVQSAPSNPVPSVPFNAISRVAQSAVSITNELQNPVSTPIVSSGPSVPLARHAIQVEAPSAAPNELQNPLPKQVLSASLNSVPSVTSNTAPNALQRAAPNTGPHEMQNPFPKEILSGLPIIVRSVPSDAAPSTAHSVAPAFTQEIQNPLAKVFLSAPLSTVPSVPSNAAPRIAQSAAPAITQELQKPLANEVLSAPLSTVPSVTSNAAQSAAPAITQELQKPFAKEVLSAPLSKASSVPSNAAPSTTQSAAPSITQELQNPLSKEVLNALLSTVPDVPLNAAPKPVQGAGPNRAPNEAQNPLPEAVPSVTPSAVPKAFLNADPAPAPVPHTASNGSAKSDLASASNRVSNEQAATPAGAPDLSVFATDSSLGSTADQFVALTQLSGGLIGAGWAGISSLNPAPVANSLPTSSNKDKAGIKDAPSNVTGVKPNSQSTTDFAASQTGSQGAKSSGDQSQSSFSSQGQNAAAAPMVFANHSVAVVADSQNTASPSPVHSAPTPTEVAGPGAKTPDGVAHTSTAVPQALPAINTAKLIQTMGQSEMRVGMRTNEFGNISIRTSATRDLISAQISLDHAELARTLATHLPEMQARLGSNQPMDVRIDTNREGSAQGAGLSGGMLGGSSDQSREGRQQPSNAGSSYALNTFAERQFSPVATAITGEGRLSARLDIRV